MKRVISFAAAFLLSIFSCSGAAPRVTIAAANTYFNALANESRASIPVEAVGEIATLAAGLENDPALIVAYVRNNFRYVPYYGHLKGPHEVLMDQAGNDYDLARLTVELLKAASTNPGGTAITVSYVRGTITYTQANAGGWLEVASGQVDPLLNEAGIPHNAPLGGNIAIERIWVRVNGMDVDPAYKQMAAVASSINLGTLMGYNQNQLITGAAGTSGSNTSGAAWVSGVNDANVESRLKGYATTLRTALETTYPNATLADLIGGSEIIPLSVKKGDLASLAITGTSATTTFTTPDAKRMHTAKITIGADSKIVNLPDIDGRIFCISSAPGSAQPAGQTPVQENAFSSAAALNTYVKAHGEYDFRPVIQGAKNEYFSFRINKIRSSYPNSGGSDQISITGDTGGAFRLQATDGGYSTLPVNPSGTTGLYFNTPSSNTSYLYNVHVYVRKDVAPGSYQATLQIIDYSPGRTPQETYNYNLPLFATVMPNHVVQLKVGSTVVWSDTAVAAQDRAGSYEFSAAINQPNPANSGALGDGELDPNWTKQVFRGSKYVFLTQTGDVRWTGRRVSEPSSRCRELLASGAAETSDEVVLHTLSAFGSQYLLERELAETIAARMANVEYHNYHEFAIAKVEAGYTMDHILWSSWAIGRTTTTNADAVYDASSMFGSALEHGSSEQFQGDAAISTMKALYLANKGGEKIYKVDGTSFSSITGELTGYDAGKLDSYQNRAALEGITYVIHQNGSDTLNDWKGHGYIEIWPDGSRGTMIGAGFNYWDPSYGGVATVRRSSYFGFATYKDYLQSLERERLHRQFRERQRAMSAEPVDLHSGAYVYNMTELTVGNLAPPRGLDFQRSYNSDAASLDGPLGRGWDHHWNARLEAVTDPGMAMGMRKPADAAAWLVASHTMRQLLVGNQNTPKGLVIQAIVANWAVNQMKNNAVSADVANEAMVFARQPDDTYSSGPGNTMTLVKNVTSEYLLKSRFGTTFTYNPAGQLIGLSDVYNKSLTVTWANDKVTSVKDAYNRKLTFNYGSDTLLDTVTDSTGRSIGFTYLNGNLATFTDPDGNVFRYTYDSGNRLQEFRNGENEIVAFNHYDALGKVDYQNSEGDTNRQWRFFITPFRTVEQNPEGGQTIYEYDRLGRQLSQTDALGNRQTFEYNVHHLLTASVNAKQQRTEFFYDGKQNLTLTRQFKGGAPVETSATYDSAGHQDSVTNANGYSVTRHFNALHEKEWEEDPDGHRTTYSYYPAAHAAAGQIHTITIPGENGATCTTTYSYDGNGHLDRIDYPDGTSEDYTYNARGDLDSLQDRRQKLWQYFSNNRRLISREVDPYHADKLYTYNSYGKLLTATDRNGHLTTNTYYPAGRIKDSTNAENEKTTWQYDRRDWPKKVISPLGNEIETTYYANGWTDEVFDPLDHSTKSFYQPNGNREKVRNALMQETVYGFDDLNRVQTVTDSRNVQTVSTFDLAGNIRFLKNGRNQDSESVFDQLNRVTDFYTPLRRHTHRVYSPRGLLTSISEPSGDVTSLTYDPMGRAGTRSDRVGTTTYTHDGNGNLETTVEGSRTITRQYDDANRLKLYRNGDGEEIEYRYDLEGNLSKIIYPDKTKVVEYTYDNANRLRTVKDWANRITTYHWDHDGRLSSMDRANGTHRLLSYDKAGSTTSIREVAADGKLIAYYQFERDALNRVKYEIRAPKSPVSSAAAQNATYDADDRLVSFNGQTVTNDADGNMTSAPLSAGTWKSFHYDARNRLTDVGGTANWENVFDAEGLRVETRESGISTRYVVSPGALPKTLVQIHSDGTRRYFIYGLGLLYHIDGEHTATPATTRTYHYNAQGSTIALSDDSGQAVGRFHYDPYGLMVAKDGDTDTVFQFNGHYGILTDPTGLIHLNARFYNPYLKRFMNSDPSGFSGGMNWFAYASGDPVNQFDPLGLGAADSERYTWVDGIQDGIGVAGMIPGLGVVPDGVNTALYLFRGKWGEAGMSALALIPFLGDVVAGGKYVDKLNDVRRIAEEAEESYEIIDGVRRSKAAQMAGHSSITAEIYSSEGILMGRKEVLVDSLLSPNKSVIEVRNLEEIERFASIHEATLKRNPLPPIKVSAGSNGATISEIKFNYGR